MALYDAKADITLAVGVQATLSGATPAKGNIVDLRGFAAVVFGFFTGLVTDAGTAEGFSIKLQESDSTKETDFADVDAADHTGGLQVTSDTYDIQPVGLIGYTGTKRYVRAVVTGSTGSDAVINGAAILTRPDYGPSPDIAENISAT